MRLAEHQECTQQSQAERDGVLPNWDYASPPRLIATQTSTEEEAAEKEKRPTVEPHIPTQKSEQIS